MQRISEWMTLQRIRANWKPIAVMGGVAVLAMVAVVLAIQVLGGGQPSASAGPVVAVSPSPLAASPTVASPSVEPSATPTMNETASAAPSPDTATEQLIGAEGIAFVHQEGADGFLPWGQLYVVDADASVRQLTALDTYQPTGGVQSMKWSPDGEHLAYAYGTSLTAGIVILDPDGGEPQQLDVGGFYFWSPDGSRLAVGGQLDMAPPDAINSVPVSVVDPVTGHSEEIASGLLQGWHPDGQRVLVMRSVGADETTAGAGQLLIVSVVDGSEEELIQGATTARWSPDGTQVAYLVEDNPCIGMRCQRILVGGDGSDQLTDVGTGFDPVWSPDGTRLAYTFSDETGAGVAVVEVASGRRVEYPAYAGYPPAWSSDGRRIAVGHLNELQESVIRVVEVESGQIVVEFPGMSPSWRPEQ